jgi:HSP20 family molecular chaperone IbpA
MEFALAGFQKSDLTIEVKPEKRSITVSAQAEGENETGRRIARRSFSKTYVNYDDNLDLSEAQAKFEDGLLTVTVPTRPEVKPLSIEIG